MLSRPILAAALLSVLSIPAFAQAPALEGRWISVAPEAAGPIFGRREFSFAPGTWQVRFTAYADAAGSQPLFALETGGPYVLGGPSATVPGATEAVFLSDRRSVTALSAGGVQMFASTGCTLVVGAAMDLTAAGCGFLPSLMQAMGEYDLVAPKGDELFLGDRSGDLSKARPTALSSFPLVRG